MATHLAAGGLANNECEAAVAAGVFMVLLGGTMAGICQLQVFPANVCPLKPDHMYAIYLYAGWLLQLQINSTLLHM